MTVLNQCESQDSFLLYNEDMILNVSGRCDIVAFFSEWFMNRYEEGYVDVRNPFYPKKVSRIYFENVDAIVFCTKNPMPILPYLDKINKPILFQVTLTPYHSDIELHVPDKNKIIEAIQKLAVILPKESLYVRYDPIFINDRYTLEYHIKAFERLCERLEDSVSHMIVSFLDDYKNVQRHSHEIKAKKMTEEDYEIIGRSFAQSAFNHHMTVQTCAEEKNLVEYGFIQEDCVSKRIAYQLTHKKFKKWNARGKNCQCVEMADIGVYNTCAHFCKYCYANYDEKKIKEWKKQHDPTSSLLIGHLKEDDILVERK